MNPDPIDRALYAMFTTHALHLADKHGVLTHLRTRGPADAATVAVACRLDPETLDRLLILLAAERLVERDANGAYRVAGPVAPYLDPDSPRYLGAFLDHLVHNTAGQLQLLGEYLTRGKDAVDAGRPEPFDGIYRDEAATAAFLAAMWQISYEPSKELVRLAGLRDDTDLVDVGGASGAFAVAALRHHPGLRATVFDLPQVEPHLLRTAHEQGLADRLGFVAGDFFRDELPEADSLSFGYILSDWPDDSCVDLLRKAYKATRPGGRVLIMERLFDDDGGPLPTAAMNLSMHVETKGRHRTAAEYTRLLTAAGFGDCATYRSSWDKHLVAGRKS